MTINSQGQRVGIPGKMDTFVPSPEYFNFTGSDHVLPNNEIATYAASPNSLYMYEQEKYDMQHSLGGAVAGNNSCQNSGYSVTTDEFDLKPQYEISNEINFALTNELVNPDSVPSPVSMWNVKSEDLDKEFSSMIYSVNKNDGPTLAQLNMDESLIDEVVSIVNADSASGYTSTLSSTNCSRGDNSTVSVPPVCCTVTNNISPVVSTTVNKCGLELSKTSDFPRTSIWSASGRTNVVTPKFPSVHSLCENGEKEDDKTALHKLLMKSNLMPASSHSQSQIQKNSIGGQKRSATVARIDDGVEEKWKEIEKFIHDCDTSNSGSSQNKRSRLHSGSSATSSNNDDDDDDDDDANSDNDLYNDSDSDMEDFSDEESGLSQLSPLEESLGGTGKRKEKQYFWQYNVQSKGPKGTRLCLALNETNPHVLNDFEDPVFDPGNTTVAGIRHGGKARKGDGNDVKPNPKRLCQIGLQIKKLNRQINEVAPGSESSTSARNKSRKEKNKLASRACRLKKKAQHEAFKVKLYGLEQEHRELMDVLQAMKIHFKDHLNGQKSSTEETLTNTLENMITKHLKCMVAGHTTEFVNSVIMKVETGDVTGGLVLKSKNK